MLQKRICVIGAGASGLPAIKACIEEDLDVACYEKNHFVGGLWQYRDEIIDGESSVTKSTIMNTSKELLSFSDYPVPKEYPNFMHNRWLVKYLRNYAQDFNLIGHIKFKHMVLSIEPEDYDISQQWKVRVRNLTTGEISEEIFDGVMVCNGHHGHPKKPNFPGLDIFKGSVVHTHEVKTYDQFRDKNVVVIGIGSSGADAAVESSFMAHQVYLSAKRGTWLMQRLGSKGYPTDCEYSRFWIRFSRFIPFNLLCWYLERRQNSVFDHGLYRLKPKHRILNQHGVINDDLPGRILSGTVMVKGNVEKFTENGVFFEDETAETPIDSVIMATGYDIKFPFLGQNIVSVKENEVNLYKMVFPPKYPTLALIGLIQPLGSIFPVSEIQCRWFVSVMVGKSKLPSVTEMQIDASNFRKIIAKHFYISPRHTLEVEKFPYMDTIASFINVKPNLLWLFLIDPKLWYRCFFGPMVAFQFRLQGPNAWEGARDAILKVNDRIFGALQTKT